MRNIQLCKCNEDMRPKLFAINMIKKTWDDYLASWVLNIGKVGTLG